MKKNYFLAVLFTFAMVSVNAQFTDDMESYTDGQPISGGHWTDWGCGGGAGCAIMSTSAQAQGGVLSGLIPGDGTTDAVLDLGNKIFGQWGLEFWMYIPTDQRGYWNLQGTVPIGAGEWAIGNVFFNDGANNTGPGTGYIDWSTADAADDTFFDYPEATWFRVVMNWDISGGMGAATWELNIDGVEVVAAGTPYTDGVGTVPTSLGGFDFWSNTPENEMYLDSFVYQDSFIILGTDDLDAKGFVAYPNPVSSVLNLKANEAITSVSIINILGQEVYNSSINSMNASIDMSSYASGAYFVRVNVNGTEGIVKIVK